MEPRVLTHEDAGAGPPLVLVPGGLTGWLSWVPFVEPLSASHRVTRVQPIQNELGSAGRPGDPSYGVDTEREALRMTLDALDVERADFAGWSGGARALIEFAIVHPGRVRSLTLIEPPAAWVLERLGIDDPELDTLRTFEREVDGREVSEDDLVRFAHLAGFVPPEVDPRTVPPFPMWATHRQALSWQGPSRSTRTLEDLTAIRAPVVLVRGTSSPAWLREIAARLVELLPDATLAELPGDHACHLQNQQAFLDLLEKHVAAAG